MTNAIKVIPQIKYYLDSYGHQLVITIIVREDGFAHIPRCTLGTAIPTKPKFRMGPLGVVEHFIELSVEPAKHHSIVDRGFPRMEQDGVRTFKGEQSGLTFKVLVPNYYSHWLPREGEHDICTYCGSSNGYYGADGQYIDMRQGYDCCYCGGN